MSPSTVPQTGPFFHQFSVDLNSAGCPTQQSLPPLPTNGDNIGNIPPRTDYQTFGDIDAFGALSHVNSTATVPNTTYDPENAPVSEIGVAYLDGHVGFENGNPIVEHAHARPDSVQVVTNQADTALPSQFQPFDVFNLNMYDQSWPSTTDDIGYTQNNPTQSTTLPSDNYRRHGTAGPIAPNGHHSAQASAVLPFEQHRGLGPAALVVIPGVPAFSIPLDVANVLLTMSRHQ